MVVQGTSAKVNTIQLLLSLQRTRLIFRLILQVIRRSVKRALRRLQQQMAASSGMSRATIMHR